MRTIETKYEFLTAMGEDTAMPASVMSTGESRGNGVEFIFKKGGSASVVCYDYAEHINKPNGLDVSISNKEFDEWLISFN